MPIAGAARRARPRRARRRAAGRARRARAALAAGARAGLPRCLSCASPWATPASRSRPSATTRAAIATGMGGTMRDGLAVRAERGGVGLAITDVLLLDPVLGVRRTSIGVDGRPRRGGRAARAIPTRWTRSTSCSTPPTAVLDGRSFDRDARRHRLPRALALAADLRRGARRRADDARDAGLRAGLEPRLQPAEEGLRATWAALEAHPAQRVPPRARLVRAARAGRAGAARRRRRAQDPRGRRRRARAAALRARHRGRATTCSSRSTPTA